MVDLVDLDDIKQSLASRKPSARAKGMEQLIATGNVGLLVAHALTEKDLHLIGYAVDLLYPRPPPELLCHLFSVGRSPTPLRAIEYWLPRNNYLYAEAAILDLYGQRIGNLAASVIRTVGRSYLKSFTASLAKLLGGSLVNAKTAVDKHGVKALTGGDYSGQRTVKKKPDGSLTTGWEYLDLEKSLSGESQRIVEAAVALRRLDAPIDMTEIDRLIGEAETCTVGAKHWSARLEWVRFDVAADGFLDSVMARGSWNPAFLPDLALDLLKRDLTSEIQTLAAKFGPFSLYNPSFCYWPLLDHLDRRGILKVEEKWLGAADYFRARKHGVAPPPWWQWIS
jgi:hypothetical protein